MSQTGPWSVKGIDSRAREAAREAAREEGSTLGAYLNRLILDDDQAPAEQAPLYRQDPIAELTDRPSRAQAHREPAGRQQARAPAYSDEPSTAALDRLTRRIESTEARSTLAITGIDQSVVGLLSRLENAEHNQQALGNHWENVLGDVQKTYDILNTKISAIEADDSTTANQAALRSLEEALGKLASHVYEENELVSEESSAIKFRLESGLGELATRMDTVDERVEARLNEASATVTKAVADSQMRVEGTNRHLAERFSSLESNVQNELSSANNKATEFEQALHENHEQIGTIQARLNRAEASTNEALEHLQSTFKSLDERLGGISQEASTEVAEIAEDIRKQFDAKFDSLADDMRTLIASTRAEMASEIESAAKSVDGELISRLEDTISAMAMRLDASEDLHAQTMEMVGDTVTRVTESVDQRLIAGQNQQSRDIEQISAQVIRISDGLDERLNNMVPDEGSDAATAELREDMVRFTNSIDARFDQLEAHDTSSIDNIASEVEQLADKLNDRVQESEQRSAAAIEQVGQQIATVADRLEHRQSAALQEFSEKLDASTQNHEARLSSALTNVSDRLERIQEQSIVTISPVQKAIATLAQRIEAIEDFSAPPYIERDGTPNVPQMVSPVKIDTKIEQERGPFELPDTVTTSASIAAVVKSVDGLTKETTPAPTAEEPFEAGYKNWSNDAADMLDEQESQSTVSPASTEETHDYFAELPPPIDSSEDMFDASNEARDSDIFEEEPFQISDVEADKVDAFEATANPYAEDHGTANPLTGSPNSSGTDYMAQARAAAVAASAQSTAGQRPSKSRPAKPAKKSGGNGPAIAAGIGLLAVAGTAGFFVMGKDSNPEAVNLTSTQTSPTSTANTAALSTDTPAPSATTGLAALNAQINTDDANDAVEAASLAGGTAQIDPTPAIVAEPVSAPEPLEVVATNTAAPVQINTLTVSPIAEIKSIADFADNGNAIAQFQLGSTKIANGDIQSGVALLQSANAKGLASAQYELANLHVSGLGVAKDPSRAIPLFKKAAEAGNVGAMHNYATLIADTPSREAEAANWYLKAAEFGLVEAQFNIATMYESGIGVSPSLTEALYWYEVAGANGDRDAPSVTADLIASGEISSAAVSQIKQRAAAWTAKPTNAQANGTFSQQPWSGLSKAQITGVQEALNSLNYDAGSADGSMGATTRRAIKAFQADGGQAQTGKIDNSLIESLNIATSRPRRSL